MRGSVGIPGVGIDAMPPSASGLPARLVLGPALRAQSDRRLVRLVREGYESAFEEIVRRYRRPLDRFAAGIVGGRSEDVTQDSFRKALEALRHGDSEMELRPWLYRIVRNTALNDLRDRPPAAAELVEDLVGGARSAAAEAEERAEVAALTARLRALPENQRAALVMRELEGMSHEEIAASLGISGGAARQAIARARTAVRSGFGALVPLPLLRALAGGSDGAAEAAAGAAGAGGAAAIGAGGLGAGALKVSLATVAVVGSIGAGVAIHHHGSDHPRPEAAKAAAPAPDGLSGDGVEATPSPAIAEIDDHSSRAGHDFGDDHGGRGPNGRGRDHRGHGGSGRSDDGHESGSGHGPSSGGDDGGSGRGGPSGDSHRGGPEPSGTDDFPSSGHGGSGSGDGDGSRHGGNGGGSGDHSGDSGSGSGSGHSSGSSGGGSGSGSSTSTSGGHGSDDAAESIVGTETATSTSSGSESSSSGSGSSGGSGSSDSPTTSGDISSSSGSSGGPSPSLDSTIVTDDGSGSGSGGGSGSSGGS